MSRAETKRVGVDEDGMRLDRWFRTHFPDLRHGALEKLLRTGQVRVNGGRIKAGRRLAVGEEVRIPPNVGAAAPAPRPRRERPDDKAAIRELILYEDDAVIALNKPFGLAVQGGAKTGRHLDAMLEALAHGADKPRLVHRLDKDTGGLLLVAKTRIAAQRLGAAFKSHAVEKTYWALVAGVPHPRAGTIELPIGKQKAEGAERMAPAAAKDAKNAVTDYQTVEVAGPVAFLALRPITGRTHQLRVHAAAMGFPIVSDGKYGGKTAYIEGVAPRLHLFCRAMTFPHPETARTMTLWAPLTGHMAATWEVFGFDAQASVSWPEAAP
jgi:23S rRNA pseudouridine955/2504/2580 synthase